MGGVGDDSGNDNVSPHGASSEGSREAMNDKAVETNSISHDEMVAITAVKVEMEVAGVVLMLPRMNIPHGDHKRL